MVVERAVFTRLDHADSPTTQIVEAISNSLLQHLSTKEALDLISTADQPGASSALVQETFRPFAETLGFRSEAKGLFTGYPTPHLRPDYYMPAGDSGILLEVERGKTTINNMDLLDLWKCHVCATADYLFLLAPRALRQNPTMRPKNEYASVVKRMSTFFHESTYTNVRALHIFGY